MITIKRTLAWKFQHDDRFIIEVFRVSTMNQFKFRITGGKTVLEFLFAFPSMEEAIAEAEREVKSIYIREEKETKQDGK